MRIVFDPQIFCLQEYGGISRYFCSLARSLSLLQSTHAEICAPFHINQHLKSLNGKNTVGFFLRQNRSAARLGRMLNPALFFASTWCTRPDIVHETYFSNVVIKNTRAPRVLTVFDLIHERYPLSFPASDSIVAKKRSSILRADHIFCISENTRRDLMEFYRVPDERVSVTYLACDELSIYEGASQEPVSGAPFLLFVGQRGGYKNFAGFAKAFAASILLKKDFQIVCFGGGAFSSEERKWLSGLGLMDKMTYREGGDARLAMLYRTATAFVYPSLYEGFGIPPLEAMSQNCPIICSNTSSIPEVVGGAGEYFDPSNIESITHALEQVVQSPARREALVQMGAIRHRGFSWERCAHATRAGYELALH